MNVLPVEWLWLDLYEQVAGRNSGFDEEQLYGLMHAFGNMMFWGEDLSTIADLDENYILSLSLLGDIFL